MKTEIAKFESFATGFQSLMPPSQIFPYDSVNYFSWNYQLQPLCAGLIFRVFLPTIGAANGALSASTIKHSLHPHAIQTPLRILHHPPLNFLITPSNFHCPEWCLHLGVFSLSVTFPTLNTRAWKTHGVRNPTPFPVNSEIVSTMRALISTP
jgi:hypothetical protein